MADLTHWASVTPDSLALVTEDEARTFAQLDANANRLARALRARGLVAGDAVALLAGNRPAFVETVYACQRAGYRLTTVNWHLTGDEASYIVDDCEARALIATHDVADVAGPTFAGAPDCKVGLVAGGAVDGFEPYEDALAAELDEPVPDPSLGTTMLYTSGTTGRPKGVHRPPAAAAAATVNLYGYDETGGDVNLCTGPLYHAAPLAFSLAVPIAFGATVVLMDRWDAGGDAPAHRGHGVTHMHMVPTMFHRLLSLPDDVRDKYDLSTLRHVLHGAAPCPVAVKQRMIEWLGPIILEYYAATEGVGSFVDSTTWLEHPGTVGRPFTEGQVVIGDHDGHAAAGR